MSKQFWAVIAVIILVVAGIIFTTNKQKSSENGGSNSSVSATNHVRGQGSTGVVLVEYGDFQCPACEAYYPIIEQVYEKYQGQITFQFRNFPLTTIHQNAFAGARAAEAAALQGKFWEMHQALYTEANWTTWSNSQNPKPYFEQYAKALGLNVTKFDSDYSSDKVNDTVRADLAAGQKLGIQGTPTFFLNDKQVANAPQNVEDWSKLIDAAIKSKQNADI
ncbi:MAG: Protein-disulfide isomerase [Candidatus Saccharibacteria bacterium]|nr:Protein-disulfide isomerase [Candidatus Saccharibacteria bacterium]